MYTSQQEFKLRNVFRQEDNPQELQEALAPFPNNVPRFTQKSDCIDFMRLHSGVSSNPDFPELRHSVTTLVSWKQIEKYLLPKLIELNQMESPKEVTSNIGQNNRFMNTSSWLSQQKADEEDAELTERSLLGCRHIRAYLLSRVNLPIHQHLSHYSTLHTLQYLFYHMKCGILVSIRNNKLVVFCPFVNKDYENNWHDILQVEGTLDSYYLRKSRFYRDEDIIEKSKWWANGNIMCNEQDDQLWGDHFLLPLRDMLAETCNNREIPDCDFFLNKRDYPQLKFNTTRNVAVEPYGFIYDCDDKDPEADVDLTRHNYPTFAPILSFYTSDRFADIPFPPSEDWEAATGEVFPPSMRWQPRAAPTDGSGGDDVPKVRDLFTADNLKKFDKHWSEKRDVAFFRGTATGGGVNVATNQRLNVAVLSEEWSADEKYAGYLDAKIVGWNMRDKKLAGSKMNFINQDAFPFKVTKANFTPIYEQSTYKYLLYIEGHCAACRYGFMMVLGSVILKVESQCVADQLWYFPLLKPYFDHVPVKADLSDLAKQIEWCRNHDEECKQIAQRAREIHDRFLAKEGILDYMQMSLCEISRRWVRPLDCFRDSSTAKPIPYDAASDNRSHCLEIKGEQVLCATCEVTNAIQEKKMQEQLKTKVSGGEKLSGTGSLLRKRAEKKRRREEEESKL